MVSCLLPLWCIITDGYQISSDNSNSQQQPTTGYKQTSKLLPSASSPTSMKTTYPTNIHTTYNSGPVDKETLCNISHEICHNPPEFYEYYAVYYIPII